MTQLEAARKGIVTEEMAYVAEQEGVSPEFVREGIAAGRIVLPRNPNHKTLTDFKGIGEGLSVKVNANLGTSYDYVNIEEEVEKAKVAIRYGAVDIARTYDLTLSLGDGLRPGSLADSTDRAQIAELLTIGELVERARRAGVQAMVEGPGHIPLNEVAANVQIQKKLTGHAPFYILGMLPVDTAAGFDHIAGAIGGPW
jgi:thiamine biosynthesis protein ThiC